MGDITNSLLCVLRYISILKCINLFNLIDTVGILILQMRKHLENLEGGLPVTRLGSWLGAAVPNEMRASEVSAKGSARVRRVVLAAVVDGMSVSPPNPQGDTIILSGMVFQRWGLWDVIRVICGLEAVMRSVLLKETGDKEISFFLYTHTHTHTHTGTKLRLCELTARAMAPWMVVRAGL